MLTDQDVGGPEICRSGDRRRRRPFRFSGCGAGANRRNWCHVIGSTATAAASRKAHPVRRDRRKRQVRGLHPLAYPDRVQGVRLDPLERDRLRLLQSRDHATRPRRRRGRGLTGATVPRSVPVSAALAFAVTLCSPVCPLSLGTPVASNNPLPPRGLYFKKSITFRSYLCYYEE